MPAAQGSFRLGGCAGEGNNAGRLPWVETLVQYDQFVMHMPSGSPTLLVLLAALLIAPAALAQQDVAAPDFDEQELDSFAEAYVDIETLQIQYQAQFAEVEDPAEVQQAQQQFQADASEIIEDQGLTMERYEEIIMATQTDPEFAASVLERVEVVRAERQG